MLFRGRKGYIVWGIVLIAVGWISCAFINRLLSQYETGGGSNAITVYGVLLFLFGAVVFAGFLILAGGIIYNIYVTAHNNRVFDENEDVEYLATCINCGNDVIANLRNVRFGRNYPEGYVVCPFCKKPCTWNLFDVITEEDGDSAEEPFEEEPEEEFEEEPDEEFEEDSGEESEDEETEK